MAVLYLDELTPHQREMLERRYDSLASSPLRKRIDICEMRRRGMRGSAEINRRRRGWRDQTDPRVPLVDDPWKRERDNAMEQIGALMTVVLNRGRMSARGRQIAGRLDRIKHDYQRPSVTAIAAE